MGFKRRRLAVRLEIEYRDSASTEPVTRWGGEPNALLSGGSWPRCECCLSPMSFAMQATAPVHLAGLGAIQAFVCPREACIQRPGATRVLVAHAGLSPRVARVPSAARRLKPRAMELARDDKNARAEGSDSGYERYEAGFRDKFYGGAFVDSAQPVCQRCDRSMDFLAHLIKPDLGGLEDWYTSLVHLCPRGHEGAWTLVRG